MADFKVSTTKITFLTKGDIDFVDLTDKAQQAVADSGIKTGLMHVFAPHATGILILTENDPALLSDLKQFLDILAPRHGNYRHPSNAYAHLRSVLLPPDRTLPVVDGSVELGVWQSLMFIETDVSPRNRTVIFQVLGQT